MKQNPQFNLKLTKPAYSYLRGVSYYSYKNIDRPEETENKLSNCMTSMLFSAFCLEAFLNHLGEQKLSFWSSLKEKLNPREKLDVISDVLGFKPNFGT